VSRVGMVAVSGMDSTELVIDERQFPTRCN
jgi:hypothetical protein